MKQVVFLFPTLWDEKQLDACREAWHTRVEPVLADLKDEDCPWDLDLAAWIEQEARRASGKVAGVASTSDYPGAAAAALLAARLKTAGPRPESVIRAGHKFLSRLAQAEAVPEAVPPFRLVDPHHPQDPLPFPYFVKPVRGSFSLFARRIDRPGELAAFLDRPAVGEFREYYVRIFQRLLDAFPGLDAPADRFVAEAFLVGDQVTVEGFMAGPEPTILGVVDSILDPRTGSFLRFDYPSRLPARTQRRLAEVAARAARGLALEGACFNVELIHDPHHDRIFILEVNPRICGQFADLHLEVDGASTYETLLDLALGEGPRLSARGGAHGAASSYPLRVYRPSRVARAPGPAEVAQIEARFPGCRIWLECAEGDLLQEFAQEDGASSRYAVVNVAAEDADGVPRRFEEVLRALDVRLLPASESPG